MRNGGVHSACVRTRLRRATDDAHARVDRAFSELPINLPWGLSAFLRAQVIGLRAVEARLRAQPSWQRTIARRIEAARFDLSALGDDTPIPELELVDINPLGAAYVVAGSLHGTAVLRTQWARTAERGLFPAGFTPLFFEGQAWKPVWRDVLAKLEGEEDISSLIEAANTTFSIFEMAAKLTGQQETRR